MTESENVNRVQNPQITIWYTIHRPSLFPWNKISLWILKGLMAANWICWFLWTVNTSPHQCAEFVHWTEGNQWLNVHDRQQEDAAHNLILLNNAVLESVNYWRALIRRSLVDTRMPSLCEGEQSLRTRGEYWRSVYWIWCGHCTLSTGREI